MAERGALPSLNQSTNRASQARSEERQQLGLAAQGKIALDGAFRNSILTDSRNFLRDIVSILEYAEEMRARDAKLAYEDRLEAKRKGAVGSVEKDKAKANDLTLGDYLGIGAFIAGVTSIAGAFVGLRGWELGVIRQIRDAPKIGVAIKIGSIALRNAMLRSIGLTPVGAMTRDVKGRFVAMNRTPISTQILDGLKKFTKGIRTAFGVLASPGGLNLRSIPGVGLAKNILGKIKAIGGFFGKILSPIFTAIRSLATSVTAVYNSTLAPIFSLLKGGAGFFLAVMKKIFLPIGALFSLFDGAKEFMKTEGSLFKKLNAGIAKTFADFIGAPFDLLKKGLAKLTEMFGFEAFAKKINDFSVEDTLFKIFKLPGQAIATIFGAGKKLLQGDFSGAAKTLVDPILNFFRAIAKAFMSFIKNIPIINKFFKDEEEEVGKELDKVESKKKKQLENQKLQAEAELKSSEEILKIKEEIKALLDGRNKGDLRNQEIADFNKLQRTLRREEDSLEKAQEKLAGVNDQLAKLQKKENELTAKLAKQDKFLPTPTLGSTPSGNGSADMLNALNNFSGGGLGGTRMTDNSTKVGDSTSVSISNQSFQSGPKVTSNFKNYFAT